MLKLFPHLFVNILPTCLKKSANLRRKLFLQDGDPSHNNVKARSAWDDVDPQKFTILARCTDLNPIENIFHIAKRRLRQDALDQQITRQDVAVFS